MHPPTRSRSRGSAIGLGAALGLGMAGCDAPEPHDARAVALPLALEAGDATTGLAPAPAPERVVAAAPAASPESLSQDERQRFQAEVGEGRRLHQAQDYEGALAAYARALDLVPDDPRTLSEQGWAALFAGRLTEADAALRHAEQRVGDDDPKLRASILYNQGRVAEARNETHAAIDAYQRSLRLRPHSATYQHLVALEGGTRYAFGPAVRRLQGPYARLGELCQQERALSEAAGEGDGTTEFACLPDAAKGSFAAAVEVVASPSPASPWKALRFVETRPSPYAVRVHAALRTDEGWFALPDVAALSRGTPGTTESATRLGARVEPLGAQGALGVVLEVETRWVVTAGSAELESETHRVEFLCGVGPSGVPSCTGALPRASQARRRGTSGEVEQSEWAVSRLVTPEGLLVLEGDRDALDEPVAAVLGEHPVAFP